MMIDGWVRGESKDWCVDGWRNSYMSDWRDELMNGWMDDLLSRWMDGWMDG